ncbi:Thioredoxin [Melia azedarach]|uniref:Thioredoxin n=1 Tax=Melia azedarach TaxID=155640 RepID=A0ACC1WSA9_MELAZ|nr:Thioredoxin [Melia azedarach]
MSEVEVQEEGQVIGCHTVESWKEQFQKGTDAKKLIVVDFTASWCPPCRLIAPVFTELAKKFKDVLFLKVDVDELKSVAQEWAVEAMPTFMFLKEGKLLEKFAGANKPKLETLVAKYAAADA